MNKPVYLIGQNQTSQTGGQPYSDTSPLGDCSIVYVSSQKNMCILFYLNNNSVFITQFFMYRTIYVCSMLESMLNSILNVSYNSLCSFHTRIVKFCVFLVP